MDGVMCGGHSCLSLLIHAEKALSLPLSDSPSLNFHHTHAHTHTLSHTQTHTQETA